MNMRKCGVNYMNNVVSNNSADVKVGVLLGRGVVLNISRGMVNGNVLRLVIANIKAKTTLYFFSINDVDMETLTINGAYYDYNKRMWLRKAFPFPDVFYNRGGVAKKYKERYEAFKQEMERRGTHNLNYIKGFNKWEVYNNLNQLGKMKPYLPLTIWYTRDDDIKAMLDKYKRIYLKSTRGRKGHQVLRVSYLNAGLYDLSAFTKKGLVRSYVVDYNTLLKGIKFFYSTKDIIIQEAIDLPEYEKKIIDFRAEVQRNGQGELEYTSICARLGQPNSPITTHGEAYSFENFFKEYKGYNDKQIGALRRKVEKFLYTTYTSIESFYGPIGELGIDFALDRYMRIWYIECNSTPAKVSLIKAYDAETVEKAFLNPLEYSKYLVLNKRSE